MAGQVVQDYVISPFFCNHGPVLLNIHTSLPDYTIVQTLIQNGMNNAINILLIYGGIHYEEMSISVPGCHAQLISHQHKQCSQTCQKQAKIVYYKQEMN